MPAILLPEQYSVWLDTGLVPADKAVAMLYPVAMDFLESWPVGTRVNNVANDDPDLIKPRSESNEPRDLFD
jgi:putative SOS response-associated peptidase YedK